MLAERSSEPIDLTQKSKLQEGMFLGFGKFSFLVLRDFFDKLNISSKNSVLFVGMLYACKQNRVG